ncbi:MAG: septum formation initiator family protein [Candidatus Moraniibacteriota bacterium]
MFRRLLLGIFLILVTTVLVWLGYQTYQEFRRGQAVDREILQLKEESNRIRQENTSLKNNIEYLKTDDFQKREAKGELNYQENGERVVVFQPGTNTTSNPSSSGNKVSFSENKNETPSVIFRKPNYQIWWEQFF